MTLNLPAGLYAVFARADIQNLDRGDGQPARCTLSTGATSEIEIGGVDSSARGVNQSQIVTQDLLTLNAPGAVTLFCSSYKGYATQAKITAIKVGALHG